MSQQPFFITKAWMLQQMSTILESSGRCSACGKQHTDFFVLWMRLMHVLIYHWHMNVMLNVTTLYNLLNVVLNVQKHHSSLSPHTDNWFYIFIKSGTPWALPSGAVQQSSKLCFQHMFSPVILSTRERHALAVKTDSWVTTQAPHTDTLGTCTSALRITLSRMLTLASPAPGASCS